MTAYPPFPSFKKPVYIVLITILLFYRIDILADVWSISTQNDIVMGTDERYTSGISLDWMSEVLSDQDLEDSDSLYVDFVVSAISLLPLVTIEAEYVTVGFGIAQDIYTPHDTRNKELIEDDIPYAGHLYTKYSLFEWRENEVEETYFAIGVVGPSSGAECTQKAFHRLVENDEPQGWEHQLPDYPTFGIGYNNAFNLWHQYYKSGMHSDWIPSYGLELGNFMTGVFGGLSFRFGDNYPTNQAPVFGSINSGLNSRLALNSGNRAFGWSASIGTYLSAVAYSHVLDSSEDHEIERKALAGMAVASFALYIKNFQLFFSVQSINMNINGSIFSHGWGGITFSFNS
ncbi:MAG: lipid A deacylase LpxR family protein [Proteobacteria bacterium]|nr:lipid A deacylase LpxR family protein [Pseudomonadota bacterium]